MEDKHILILVEKYLEGSASPKETAELMEWYRLSNEQDVGWPGGEDEGENELRSRIFREIKKKTFKPDRGLHYWPRVAAAAFILLSLSLGGYFLIHRHRAIPATKIVSSQAIMPGSNGATLTLSNGQVITLGQAGSGAIAKQGQITLQKQNDSVLIYQKNNGTGPLSPGDISYNTLETPRGHQFQVVLPDGTRVWLNAASSLKYPVAFTRKTRTVELKGEAYFEVIHDDAQPFRVVTQKQIVEDIGTHFNIEAYPDDSSAKTTLLEGAAKVILGGGRQSRLLYPGEQALVNRHISIRKVDTSEAVAWKNGQFVFRSTSLRHIMQQIARWYDVDVVYENDVSGKSVWGTVSRYADVSAVLNLIELTGVAHFKTAGRKIIVTQ